MTRHELYWLGYRSGRNLAQHENEHGARENREKALRLEVHLTGSLPHRAFAVGELRGYRIARHD